MPVIWCGNTDRINVVPSTDLAEIIVSDTSGTAVVFIYYTLSLLALTLSNVADGDDLNIRMA